jgi:hypothetical protein
MVSICVAFVVLSTGTISLPAGYYRLSEIAEAAHTAGVEVTVDRNCAADVLGVRLDHAVWTSVVEALKVADSLNVKQSPSGWAVSRDNAASGREAAELKRYLAALTDGLGKPYQDARNEVDAVLALPEQDRTARLNEIEQHYPARFPLADALAGDYLLVSDTRYAQLGLPVKACGLISGGLAARISGTFSQLQRELVPPTPGDEWKKYAFLGVPAGTAEKEVADRERILQSIGWELRPNLEPESGCVGYTLSLVARWNAPSGAPYDRASRQPLIHGAVECEAARESVDLTRVLTSESITELGEAKESFGKLQALDAALQVPVGASNARRRVSDRALLWADSAGVNLVFVPSAFFDVESAPKDGETFAEAFARCQTRAVLAEDLSTHVVERLGANVDPARVHPRLLPAFTMEKRGDVYAIRDWLRCLNGLADWGSVPLPSLDNARLRGNAVSLGDLVQAVSDLDVGAAKTGLQSNSALGFCNPQMFYAFARLLKASDRITQAVLAVEPKKPLEMSLTSFTASELAALRAGLAAFADVCVDEADRTSISLAFGHLTNLDPSAFTLSVQVTGTGGYSFSLVKDGDEIWSADVRLGP